MMVPYNSILHVCPCYVILCLIQKQIQALIPSSYSKRTKQPDNEMMKEPASEEQNNEVAEDPYDIFDF